MKSIVTWFDVNNPEHIKAYKHLQETGAWPENFINFNEMDFPPLWRLSLALKFTQEYIDLIDNNNNLVIKFSQLLPTEPGFYMFKIKDSLCYDLFLSTIINTLFTNHNLILI